MAPIVNQKKQHDGDQPEPLPSAATTGSHFNVTELERAGLISDAWAVPGDINTTPMWFDVLQKTVFPSDDGVRYHYHTDGKETVLLPLRRSTSGWGIKTLESFGNFYTTLYAPLQTSNIGNRALRHLLAAAVKEHGGAHVMLFAPLDSDAPSFDQLYNEIKAIGWIPFSFFCFGNWFLKVDGDWQSYLRGRSANLRSTINRMTKKFTGAGGTLEVIKDSTNIEQAIAAFEEVYSSSWKIPEPYPEFIPALIRRMAEKGMLRLGIARLGTQAIACQLWIVTGKKASIFKVAYHEDYAEYSPGTVLTAHLLHHVIDDDHVTEVDFLKGDDKYKRIWMSHRRERRGIVAYNPATFIGLVLLAKERMGRMARSIGRRWAKLRAEKT